MSYSTFSFNRVEFDDGTILLSDGVLFPDGHFVPIDPPGC